MNDQGVDFIYSGKQPIPFMLPNGLKEIMDYEQWLLHPESATKYPLLTSEQYLSAAEPELHAVLNFIQVETVSLGDTLLEKLHAARNVVLLLTTTNKHAMAAMRRSFFTLIENKISVPVVVRRSYPVNEKETLPLYSATDIGGLLVDGFGDGIILSPQFSAEDSPTDKLKVAAEFNSLAFGILQAARTRMSKTEFISCPSCGRTLFDLQETTAMIRKHTEHLKGLKIGIMGCIVNGPGEMADADYGYVGMGKDKIALYRGQQVVKRSVSAAKAVSELIELIREDGRWIEPDAVELNFV